MLSFITPRLDILLESANTLLPSLKNAAFAGQPIPLSAGNQHNCVEKYEVRALTFYTPLSSIYPQNGYGHTILLKAPQLYFWILRSLEILMLLQSITLLG